VIARPQQAENQIPRHRDGLRPFAVGVAVFALGVSANWLNENVLISEWKTLDDFILAIVSGAIVLWYERRITRVVLQRLLIVRAMNHHVRNALQVVTYAASTQKDAHLATVVRDAVGRIDWALKEILPKTDSDTT